jgi:hypothetical protein
LTYPLALQVEVCNNTYVMVNNTLTDTPNLRGSLRPFMTEVERVAFLQYQYPMDSLTDAGTDFDKTKLKQVMPGTGTGTRAVRGMNRVGSRFYVLKVDMNRRTFNVREYAGNAYAVPVACPWKPEPDANPFPGRLDIRTVARIAFAFQSWLNAHGYTLRVSAHVLTSYRCEPCAMFATREDAERFAVESGRGWGYNPDGTTFGTRTAEDDEE